MDIVIAAFVEANERVSCVMGGTRRRFESDVGAFNRRSQLGEAASCKEDVHQWSAHSPAAVITRLLSTTIICVSSNHQHYDVIIAGGGAVGSALARLLLGDKQCHRRPLKVALLEQRTAPPSLLDLIINNDVETKTPSARAYALSPTSLSYLGSGPLRALLQSNRCGVYERRSLVENDLG